MGANTKIQAKVFNIATVGFISSNNVVVHGYVQFGTANTANRVVVVERATRTPVLGIRPGAGVPIWNGPIRQKFRGLSCSICSAGGAMTIYFD